MWNPERYLKILMYRSTSQGVGDGSEKRVLNNTYGGYKSVWYIPTATVFELEQNALFNKCYNVIINWTPLDKYSGIEAPPNLLTSITSALNEDEDVKPILVPSLQEPSTIDEVFFTENKSDLPSLCCTVFSCITQNGTLNTTEVDADIAGSVDTTLYLLTDLGTLERSQKQAIIRQHVPKLKQYFMLTDPSRQQKIIETLRSLENLSSVETGIMSPQTGQQSRKSKAVRSSPPQFNLDTD